ESDGSNESLADQTTEVIKTISEIGEYWTSDPSRTIEAQTRLFGSYLSIWNSSVQKAAGHDEGPAISPQAHDKRFNDPEWSDNPMFDALKQIYLATSVWARELVDQAEGIDEATRQKAQFYVDQINNALSPTNFPVTNPEVLRETAESNAENLARGMRMLVEDIEAGKGSLKIRQTDPTAFTVGENIAISPGKVIARNDICEIIQYAPTTRTVLERPLVIVPPWINKFYILDLNKEKSFIAWAVAQGHTVFVVSWVNPDEHQADKDFESYMREGILFALDTAQTATGSDEINTIGYCVGGTMLAITLAYMAATGDDRVKSATFFAAQLDFEHAGDLKIFSSRHGIEMTEKKMASAGYLDSSHMATAFNLMRSNDLIWPYVVNNYLKGKEPFPFDLLYWNSDATRLPRANHSFYLRQCYLENQLTAGKMKIAGKTLNLKKIKVPVYSLAAREDHIAPAKSVFQGIKFLGGPVRFVLAGSGHIAGVINPPSREKYQFWASPKDTQSGKKAAKPGTAKGSVDLEAWIAAATETPGSWWPDWQAWIEAQDKTQVKKRTPGGKALKPLGDAPGTYVLVQA
ncbi:MAG: class I poly(R)-hydroxyalkanoic acid synthase, partial [Alphaproteobacteria bacterium]